jgi:hypothetical protein
MFDDKVIKAHTKNALPDLGFNGNSDQAGYFIQFNMANHDRITSFVD